MGGGPSCFIPSTVSCSLVHSLSLSRKTDNERKKWLVKNNRTVLFLLYYLSCNLARGVTCSLVDWLTVQLPHLVMVVGLIPLHTHLHTITLMLILHYIGTAQKPFTHYPPPPPFFFFFSFYFCCKETSPFSVDPSLIYDLKCHHISCVFSACCILWLPGSLETYKGGNIDFFLRSSIVVAWFMFQK